MVHQKLNRCRDQGIDGAKEKLKMRYTMRKIGVLVVLILVACDSGKKEAAAKAADLALARANAEYAERQNLDLRKQRWATTFCKKVIECTVARGIKPAKVEKDSANCVPDALSNLESQIVNENKEAAVEKALAFIDNATCETLRNKPVETTSVTTNGSPESAVPLMTSADLSPILGRVVQSGYHANIVSIESISEGNTKKGPARLIKVKWTGSDMRFCSYVLYQKNNEWKQWENIVFSIDFGTVGNCSINHGVFGGGEASFKRIIKNMGYSGELPS